MAKVVLNDTAFRARLMSVLARAMDKASQGLVGVIRVKIGKSARIETPASRSARIRNAKARGRAFAKHRYQASRPGEPPRKRTGTLQKSIAHQIEVAPNQIIAKVGSKVPYARHLELGTSRMAPRPYLRPSLAEYRASFQNVVSTELRRQFKKP